MAQWTVSFGGGHWTSQKFLATTSLSNNW